MTIRKNKDDEPGRQFWAYVEETAARVAKWPEWKLGSSAARSAALSAPVSSDEEHEQTDCGATSDVSD